MKLTTRTAAVALALGVAAVLPASAVANDVTASETVTGGALSLINSTPGNVSFPDVALTGTSDRTVSRPQPFDVNDATGSGAGWKLTATSTTFTGSGGATLPTGAVQIRTAPGAFCDSGVTCTPASGNITYPYSLPAGATAPAATTFANATANTGMAAQTVYPSWTLTVPASAKADAYSSTWTLSLISAP